MAIAKEGFEKDKSCKENLIAKDCPQFIIIMLHHRVPQKKHLEEHDRVGNQGAIDVVKCGSGEVRDRSLKIPRDKKEEGEHIQSGDDSKPFDPSRALVKPTFDVVH